jgi:hypothetical protein
MDKYLNNVNRVINLKNLDLMHMGNVFPRERYIQNTTKHARIK